MKPYGQLAEFADAKALVAAVQAARSAGYTWTEAYTPFHVEELDTALEIRPSRIPLWTLLGAIAGGIGAYFLQWYSAVMDYPVNAGGRPLHSWPAFLPATFEMAVLGGALAAVIGMLVLNGLPRLYHPLFAIDEFAQATRHRFFLCLPARDPVFDAGQAAQLLAGLSPLWQCEVME